MGARMSHHRDVDARWTPQQLEHVDAARELEIAARRADGTPGRWTPIWAVCADGEVYVRSWHRRDTGWFGRAVRTRGGRIRVPGLEADVVIDDVGEGPAELRAAVDDAYRAKYGDGPSGAMVTPSAAATTLRLASCVTHTVQVSHPAARTGLF